MRYLCMVLLVFYSHNGFSQDEVPILGDEQTLEENSDWLEETYEKLEHFKVHPYDLNQITVEQLGYFPFVTALQLDQFMGYRKMLGPFEETLELQSIPAWDVETIRKLMPYVTVKKTGTAWDQLLRGTRKSEQMILYRTNFNDLLKFSSIKQSSSALFRYRFSSGTVQAGLQIEKDKGEAWWNRSKGIAFISGYINMKPGGFIKEFTIGDYQIGMGQGLVLGMGRGVIKSTAAMLIKRQGAALSSFRSTDENKYFRGLAAAIGKKTIQGILFISSNHIDGNVVNDTSENKVYITSLQSSGIHISDAEIFDWNAVKIASIGFKLQKKFSKGDISWNGVQHQFDKSISKQATPYNLFSMDGKTFRNMSLDFGKTIYNTHLFGELAVSNKNEHAFLLGALISMNRNLDCSILIRNYSRGYHSYLSKSFSENTEPSNEKGLYAGLSLKILPTLNLECYADLFSFPWLKYRLDKPENGVDQMIQLIWKPDKKTTFTVRYKDENKYVNIEMQQPLHWVGSIRKIGIRYQMEHHPNLNWKWRTRVEMNQVFKQWSQNESGILVFLDLFWTRQNFTVNGRLMYCHTDGFDSRIYAYENDVLYYGHISQFQGRIIRSYFNLEIRVYKYLHLYTKISSSMVRTEFIFKF